MLLRVQASCLSLFPPGCTSIDPISPLCCSQEFRDIDNPALCWKSLLLNELLHLWARQLPVFLFRASLCTSGVQQPSLLFGLPACSPNVFTSPLTKKLSCELCLRYQPDYVRCSCGCVKHARTFVVGERLEMSTKKRAWMCLCCGLRSGNKDSPGCPKQQKNYKKHINVNNHTQNKIPCVHRTAHAPSQERVDPSLPKLHATSQSPLPPPPSVVPP